jgi:hypothetical protein
MLLLNLILLIDVTFSTPTADFTQNPMVDAKPAKTKIPADDSPARSSPRHFAKFIHCEYLAGVTGMFSLDTVLENR